MLTASGGSHSNKTVFGKSCHWCPCFSLALNEFPPPCTPVTFSGLVPLHLLYWEPVTEGCGVLGQIPPVLPNGCAVQPGRAEWACFSAFSCWRSFRVTQAVGRTSQMSLFSGADFFIGCSPNKTHIQLAEEQDPSRRVQRAPPPTRLPTLG